MTSLPGTRQSVTPNMPPKPKAFVLACAVALPLCLFGNSPAWGLALGRVSVQSALGEMLRAEIELAELNAEESASLYASLASQNYYRAAGLEFPSVLGQVEIKLQQRPDKRHFLQISNRTPVRESFIDLIIEARWASGRLIRDYTLLLSPPQLAAERVAPSSSNDLMLPQTATPSSSPTSDPEPLTTATITPGSSTPSSTALKPSISSPESTPQGKNALRVKPGDTANQIALEHKPSGLSLEQMLVALLKVNPQAFIQENINRLKTGSLLQLPSDDEVSAISAEQARDIVAFQSQDFNAFRKSLAANATRLASPSADQRAQGRVQAPATESKPASAAPDRLTLTKDNPRDESPLDSIAGARQKTDDKERASALQANIDSLQKISEQAKVAGANVNASATPPAEPVAQANQAAPKMAVTTMVPGSPNSTSAPTTTSPTESGFLSEFLNHPLVIPAAGVLLALLGAFGFYRSRQHQTDVSSQLVHATTLTEPAMASDLPESADGTQFAHMDAEPSGTAQDTPRPDLDLDFDDQALMASTDSTTKPEMPVFDFQGLSLDLGPVPESPSETDSASQAGTAQDSPAPETVNQANS